MRICLFNAVYDRRLGSLEELLSEYWHIPCLANAMARRGHAVSILQAHNSKRCETVGETVIETVIASRAADRANPDRMMLDGFAEAQTVLDRLQPEAVHFFGLTMPAPLRSITIWAAQRGAVVSASFHGGRPRRNPLVRLFHSSAYRGISALMFSTQAYADEWLNSGLLPGNIAVSIVPEVSSPFRGIPESEARARLQLTGSPVLVSTARLHPVKDPMTVIKGFEKFLLKYPNAQLVMAYQSDELLAEISDYLRDRADLTQHIRLLGRMPHSDIEVLFSAADAFVQASIREFGSNSLVEAMSCGAVPVLSDIPSFRMLTQRISSARLFQSGDSDGLAAALNEVFCANIDEQRSLLRKEFAQNLSYDVLAEKYESALLAAASNAAVR